MSEDTLARLRDVCLQHVDDALVVKLRDENAAPVEAVLHSLMRVYQEARGIFLEGCRCGLCEAVSDVDAALAGVPAPEDSPAEKKENNDGH